MFQRVSVLDISVLPVIYQAEDLVPVAPHFLRGYSHSERSASTTSTRAARAAGSIDATTSDHLGTAVLQMTR